jgi:hypothetical protein
MKENVPKSSFSPSASHRSSFRTCGRGRCCDDGRQPMVGAYSSRLMRSCAECLRLLPGELQLPQGRSVKLGLAMPASPDSSCFFCEFGSDYSLFLLRGAGSKATVEASQCVSVECSLLIINFPFFILHFRPSSSNFS